MYMSSRLQAYPVPLHQEMDRTQRVKRRATRCVNQSLLAPKILMCTRSTSCIMTCNCDVIAFTHTHIYIYIYMPFVGRGRASLCRSYYNSSIPLPALPYHELSRQSKTSGVMLQRQVLKDHVQNAHHKGGDQQVRVRVGEPEQIPTQQVNEAVTQDLAGMTQQAFAWNPFLLLSFCYPIFLSFCQAKITSKNKPPLACYSPNTKAILHFKQYPY